MSLSTRKGNNDYWRRGSDDGETCRFHVLSAFQGWVSFAILSSLFVVRARTLLGRSSRDAQNKKRLSMLRPSHPVSEAMLHAESFFTISPILFARLLAFAVPPSVFAWRRTAFTDSSNSSSVVDDARRRAWSKGMLGLPQQPAAL